jgi:hypothetical protein
MISWERLLAAKPSSSSKLRSAMLPHFSLGGRIDSIFGVNVRAHAERERKFGPICNVFAQP